MNCVSSMVATLAVEEKRRLTLEEFRQKASWMRERERKKGKDWVVSE